MGIREDLLKLAAEIGPRGACTPGEAKAADYIRDRFAGRGLEARVQEFATIDTYSWLYLIYIGAAIICGVLSRWFPYYVAPIAVVVAVLFALELETFPLLGRILPRKTSRNIIGEIPAESGDVGLVVVAHYDSARSALSFNPGLVDNFRLSFSLMIGAIFAVAALTVANLIVRAAGTQTNLWVWIATLVTCAYLLVPLAIMVHREFFLTYTPGANDNASGVVAMLALMDKMSEAESLTRGVMFVATGAEEVGTAGMIEFLKKCGDKVADSLIVNLDNLGTGHVCYIDC